MDFSLLIFLFSLWLLPCFLLPRNVLSQRLKQNKVHTEWLHSFKIPIMQKTLWTPIQRLSNLTSLQSHLLELFTPKAFYVCGCTKFSCCSGGQWSLLKGEVQFAHREHVTVAAVKTAVYGRRVRTQQILPTTLGFWVPLLPSSTSCTSRLPCCCTLQCSWKVGASVFPQYLQSPTTS